MVLFALMIPGIVALMGLIVDMGRLLAERRQLQATADASAWAAATEVLWGSPGNAGAVAQWYAQQNGYGPTSDATVTVSQPPTSGAYVGQSEYVQVTVRRPLTLTLAQIVHPDPITIVVTATAGPSLGPAPYGVLALNTSSGGIVLNGSVLVRNSSAASNHQISATGSGALTAGVLAAAHNGIATAGGGLVMGSKGTRSDAAVIPDPFKHLPEPPVPNSSWGAQRYRERGARHGAARPLDRRPPCAGLQQPGHAVAGGVLLRRRREHRSRGHRQPCGGIGRIDLLEGRQHDLP